MNHTMQQIGSLLAGWLTTGAERRQRHIFDIRSRRLPEGGQQENVLYYMSGGGSLPPPLTPGRRRGADCPAARPCGQGTADYP